MPVNEVQLPFLVVNSRTTSTSTLTSRTVNHGMRMLRSGGVRDLILATCQQDMAIDSQDSHSKSEPKVLLTDHMGSAKVPGSSYWVIDITFIVHSQYL